MLVTFTVATHSANPAQLSPQVQEGLTSDKIFAWAAPDQYKTADKVLQFGLGLPRDVAEIHGRDFSTKIPHLIPSKNSFVRTVIDAYNKHHALIIRPDDVWLAILTQFNFFVNANAEALRAAFVSHEGKRKLVITEDGDSQSLDFGEMARKMVDLVDKNVADPTLREWALPTFSTTTTNDTTVAAVLLMSTLKAYFEYGFCGIACGIPRVTIEGEKGDWEDILGRLEKLKEYGVETIAWYHLLHPVIARFVKAFDDPNGAENVDFWGKVAHFHSMGSGPSYYSGWINAFNAFNEKGRWLGYKLELVQTTSPPESLDAESFWNTYVPILKQFPDRSQMLTFDGSPYHRVDSTSIPPGYTEVDVSLDDNGKKYECAMVAGMIGTLVTSSGDDKLSAQGKDDTVRPVAGWWMFVKN
ncbi:hypothetical protein R3P38DRAFT_3547566 [Favolaschia claudopus]|uniref:Uncharacterized protein n=1 Tax=Favolaschia claudopus TaxID=2862362 RepID=A0AAW0E2V1_9AGAR